MANWVSFRLRRCNEACNGKLTARPASKGSDAADVLDEALGRPLLVRLRVEGRAWSVSSMYSLSCEVLVEASESVWTVDATLAARVRLTIVTSC